MYVMSDAFSIREVEGWPLGFTCEGEPRIRDLDLGERLGFDRPRDVRKLVARMVDAGKLNDVDQRATVARGEGAVAAQPVTEYWLTEAQALKVAARSETDIADALLDEMIHVFMLARRGELPASAPEYASARAALPDLAARAVSEGDWSLVRDLAGILAGPAPKGQLRLFPDAGAEEHRQALEDSRRERILAAVAAHPGLRTADAVVRQARVRRSAGCRLLLAMVGRGELARTSEGYVVPTQAGQVMQ